MASVSTDQKTGLRKVQFSGLDGKRRTLRLGKVPLNNAHTVCDHVEEILNAGMLNRAMRRTTAEWLADLAPVMLDKLAAVGLIHPQGDKKAVTLGEFLNAYLARRSDVKGATVTFYGHTIRNLLEVFGADRPLNAIHSGDADDFRRHLLHDHEWKDADGKRHKRKSLSAVTVARRCSLARTFFRDAVRRKLIDTNPFQDIGGGPKANAERQQFIDQATINQVIDACPNAEWRLLVALSRFGGLRIPSEALMLRWNDIDLPTGRMTIHSPKTEHHIGKATRVVPIFTELRPYIEDALELAPDGAEFVLPSLQREAALRGDWRAVNLRTRFEKIIKRAGVTPWPRLWHNLRSSRQTELTESFPAHVVSMWLGNSERIAAQHYLQVLDSHFAKATQNPTQHTLADGQFQSHRITENAKTLGKSRVLALKMGDEGLEPPTSTV